MKKLEDKKEMKEEKEVYQIPKSGKKMNFIDVYEGW
jgi:hypothetical protein